jgi:hypothetical protein
MFIKTDIYLMVVRRQLLIIASIVTTLLCVIGCCTSHYAGGRASYVPICFVGKDGLRYDLLAPYSIQQRIDSETQEDRHLMGFIQSLQEKFPDDKSLKDYLLLVGDRLHKEDISYIDRLGQIKDDLAKSGGELYDYKTFKNGYVDTNAFPGMDVDVIPGMDNRVEIDGWLILTNGNIFKKY